MRFSTVAAWSRLVGIGSTSSLKNPFEADMIGKKVLPLKIPEASG